jgi:hypothetical protein
MVVPGFAGMGEVDAVLPPHPDRNASTKNDGRRMAVTKSLDLEELRFLAVIFSSSLRAEGKHFTHARRTISAGAVIAITSVG